MNDQSHLAPSSPVYPGTNATVGSLLCLADEYYVATAQLIGQEDFTKTSLFAPARLCLLQATEIYLSAFLRFNDVAPATIRTYRHGLADRAAAAQALGLNLKSKTISILHSVDISREYLLVRYAPERQDDLAGLPSMFSALNDVTRKVTNAIRNQPYPPEDPRYRKVW